LLRLPALLAGLLSLWLVWLLMQRLQFTLTQQLITAALAACLPGLLWMGQDARAYGLLGCLFLAALWFALQGRWVGLFACCGLMTYCHSTGPVYALAALAVAIYTHPHEWRQALLCGLLSGLAWLPAMLRILQDGGSLDYAWGSMSTLEVWWLSGFAAAWTNVPMVQFFIGSVILLATFCLLLSGNKAPARIVTLIACYVPLVGMMLFSLYRNVIIYRTLMPLLFPFTLWLGWELGAVARPVWLRLSLSLLWAVALLMGLLAWHPADRGGELNRVAAQIRANWQPGDQLVYATITVGLPMEYYLGDLPQTWLKVIQAPLLDIPAIPHTVKPCPQTCQRFWVVIPDDHNLITPAEWASLQPYIAGGPVYSVRYMQSATINVYLDKP
jgi:hypothetical protein